MEGHALGAQVVIRQDHGQDSATSSGKSVSDIVVRRDGSFGGHDDGIAIEDIDERDLARSGDCRE